MSMEAIKTLTTAEEESSQLREIAIAQGHQLLEDTQRNGRNAIAQAVLAAEDVAKKMIADAEMDAKVISDEFLKDAQASCDAMEADARTRMNAAIERIAERVVKN